MTLDAYFAGYDRSREIFEVVRRAVEADGQAELRVGKSQIAFQDEKAFAWVWIPARYLLGKSAPLVLTLSFRERDPTPRWKKIVEAAPRRFTHHLELYTTADIDEEVRRWLREARVRRRE